MKTKGEDSEQLCREYSGMIRKLARRLSSGGNFEDLVQEGYGGLLKAARRAEDKRDFGAYAYTCIRYAMLDFLEQDNSITMSRKAAQKTARVHKAIRAIEAQRQFVTPETVAAKTGTSVDEVIRHWDNQKMIPLDYVTPEGTPLIDLLPSHNEDLDECERRIWLEQIFEVLSDKQRNVLNHYLSESSNQEIAQAMDLSREQVKYVKYRAIKRLANHNLV